MIGGRILIEKRGHIHDASALEALGHVQRPDLRPQATNHEVLKDPRGRRHWISLSRLGFGEILRCCSEIQAPMVIPSFE